MERVVITVHIDDGDQITRYTNPVERIEDEDFARIVVDAQHIGRDGVTRWPGDGTAEFLPSHRISRVVVAREPV